MDSIKLYDSCLIVGRFQTLHIGHESLFQLAKKLCDRVYVFVGSAQESGTERNPFNVATRIKMIKECYGDDLFIYALPDLTNENDISFDWGKFILTHIDKLLYKSPDLMIYGNDQSRSGWFDPNDIKQTAEFIVNRGTIDISATKLRELMVKDDRKEWMKWVNPKLHKMYDELRSELMSVDYYKKLK